ncbi:subtilase-type protease inhibitor [Streptomyces sp. PTM05]|uniref:Subtilase-type protease inhibitor n=1 Tax=Streptantibioticus parmotrematis TaxID=2873249 RepID=A0ABS7QUH0_9ACTN|nr:SSI family serine proteinase inhibitor [Streptantibioticus parmotrematis]MBY8886841.1 subtilase-type protease inhibitor [Streptantibioticus parmotrematis]
MNVRFLTRRPRPRARLGLALAAGLSLAVVGSAPATAYGVIAPPRSHKDVLTVAYDDGNGGVSHYTLRCHPAGGSHRRATDACRRLDTLGGLVGPTPRGQMCSMLYGGPQTAHVTGVWRGIPVDQTYDRVDGCQTNRWQRMVPVLPDTPFGTTPVGPPKAAPKAAPETAPQAAAPKAATPVTVRTPVR